MVRTKEDLLQNLKDAGCDEKTIEQFFALRACADPSGGKRLLEAHRKALLDEVHEKERRISCLDYLLYRMRKEENA